MTTKQGFNGLTEAQCVLVSYWRSLAGPDGRVRRSAIDPGALRAYLSYVSILEVSAGQSPVFRIAGTRLRAILGVEVRGRSLDQLPANAADAWSLGLEAACERGGPIGGAMSHGHHKHLWLRLPLVGRDGRISQILCHDQLLDDEAFNLARPGNSSSILPADRTAAA